MLVLQPEPWGCGEAGFRNFCLWFQNLQSLMCAGIYWEMLLMLIYRVVIVSYNCLFSRKYLPSQPSGFSTCCFPVFPAFYYKKDLSKPSVIYHSTVRRTWKSRCSLFPPAYFIWHHWLSSTTFPSNIFISSPLFFDQKLQKRTSRDYKHSSSSYQQVSQQWQEGRGKYLFFSV